MSHGRLSHDQAAAIRRYVRGREVHDLGCGSHFHHGGALLDLGAKKVVGIDMEEPYQDAFDNLPKGAPVLYHQNTFDKFKGEIDVAFLSWPVNRPAEGLLSLIASARTVIYLGSNTGGNACGTPRLFRTLLQRRVVAHVPERRNTLIVYGQTVSKPREPLLEERAGMDNEGNIYEFKAGQ